MNSRAFTSIGRTTPFLLAAPRARKTTSTADSRHLDIDELDEVIRTWVNFIPLHCHSIPNGVDWIRSIRINPSEEGDCHYALLLKETVLAGIVRLNMEGEANAQVNGEYLPATCLDYGYLLTHIAESGATSVLLVSTRQATANNTFSAQELDYIERLSSALAFNDVVLLDWLTILDDENYSWRWQCDQVTHLAYKGMSLQQFMDYGTKYATSTAVA